MFIYSYYYVYSYLRNDKTPYYIGKGRGDRVWNFHNNIIVPDDPSNITFLKIKLSKDEAFFWEKYYISLYGRIDNHTGILENKTNGGQGPNGYIQSQEHIDSKSKEFLIITPDDIHIKIKNLKEYCRINRLHAGAMWGVANGRNKSHKGYKCYYYTENING